MKCLALLAVAILATACTNPNEPKAKCYPGEYYTQPVVVSGDTTVNFKVCSCGMPCDWFSKK